MAEQAPPPRSLRRRLSPESIADLISRYKAGEPTPALGRVFGISETGVRDLLRAEGVSLRGHRMAAQDVETALRLHSRGMTITQVAAHVGYSYSAIWRVLRKHEVAVGSGDTGRRVDSGE